MNTPEKCPKCGCGFRFKQLKSYACCSQFEEDDDGRFLAQSYHCLANQRDQLAERARELEAWKESAMAVERQWDPNKLATMLGGKLGESQRAVIQREVPKLLKRVKRLESVVTDPHALWANWLRGTVKLPAAIGDIRECAEKMKRFRSRWLSAHKRMMEMENEAERASERVKRLEDAASFVAQYLETGPFSTDANEQRMERLSRAQILRGGIK